MGVTLDVLRELQGIEYQIVDIRRQMNAKERLVRAQEKKLEGLLRELDNERDNLKKIQIELDSLDLDLKARNTHVQKLRDHLNTVKTNKEYAAVLAQLNNEKADASRVEARAMERMQELDARRAEIEKRTSSQQNDLERLEELRSQAEQTHRSFAPRLEELRRQRTSVVARLDAKTLSLFDRLSERFEGEVLARVERTHPRRDEYVCGGCHLSLTAEVANALQTREDVVTCKNCGRILYYERGG